MAHYSYPWRYYWNEFTDGLEATLGFAAYWSGITFGLALMAVPIGLLIWWLS